MNKINFVNNSEPDLSAENLNQLQTNIDNAKVEKISGKELSSNDFTDAYKTKLDGIATGANKTTVENVLTSTSTTNALSANQGKVLNDKINGTILYNSSTGNVGTVTLSQSVANFTSIEIYYARRKSNGTYEHSSKRIDTPNGKTVNLDMVRLSSSIVFQVAVKQIKISGTSITVVGYASVNITSDNLMNGYSNSDSVYIMKVVGYKY